MTTEVLDYATALLREAQASPGARPAPASRQHASVLEPEPAVVRLVGVHKAYRLGNTQVPALRGVDLTIEAGELLAVCGPSGSGKTTLLNLIGLIDRPTQGSVFLGGERADDLSEDRRTDLRNQAIGYIFQTFNLVPVLSALENVLLPLQIRGRIGASERRKALELLAEVGLEQQARSRPEQMSGGQRQRVAIARALVTDPRLVIADEPTANLDTENSLRVMSLIRQLNRDHRVTFVFSTHDARVLDHVSRVVALHDGAIETGEV